MKKLLIAALLAVGATSSFAGVIGSEQDVQLPILVSGEVLTGSSENLVIETETGGLDGSMMEIRFGALAKPAKTGITSTEQRVGRFKVRRDGTTEKAIIADYGLINTPGELTSTVDNGKYAMLIGFDESTYAKTKEVSDVQRKGVALNYQLNGSLNEKKTIYDGRVIVHATLKQESQAGHFSDAQTIFVKVGVGSKAY